MQAGIFAKTFAGDDPLTVLSKAVQAGFSCVQYNFACSGLSPMPDAVPDQTIDDIASARRATGIDICALSATYNMIHPDRAVRDAGIARLTVALTAAARLSIPLVTVCTGSRDADDQWRHHPDNQTPEAWRDLIVEMVKAADLAEANGVQLGIEPERSNVVQDAGAAQRLMRDVASPSLRIVLDPANLFEQADRDTARDIVARAVFLLGDRISMAHAKDRDIDGRFVTAGKGVVDFPDLVRLLRQAGFDGPVVTHGLDEADAPAVGRLIRRWLA